MLASLLAAACAVVVVALAAPAGADAAPSTLVPAAGACRGERATSGTATQVRAMRCLVNSVRRSAGRPALRRHATLARAARFKAGRIAACGQFTHEPCGAPFSAAFRAAGWRRATMGENLAYGTAWKGSPRAVMVAWLRSPGHRANLLRRSFRLHGLAVRTVALPGVGHVRLWVHTLGR
jgi:uncharacterized protein YkwD